MSVSRATDHTRIIKGERFSNRAMRASLLLQNNILNAHHWYSTHMSSSLVRRLRRLDRPSFLRSGKWEPVVFCATLFCAFSSTRAAIAPFIQTHTQLSVKLNLNYEVVQTIFTK